LSAAVQTMAGWKPILNVPGNAPKSLPAGGRCVGGLGALRVAGPLTGPAQGIFRVLFTIGQTLPLFPASIGTPDGYPLLQLAI